MIKSIPKFRLFIYALLILGAVGLIVVKTTKAPSEDLSGDDQAYQTPRGHSPTPDTEVKPDTNTALPKKLLLDVPFTSQAPTANWDEVHNEGCEEASAIMVNSYFAGGTGVTLDPAYVEDQFSKLTDWQQQTYGYHLDITTAETARMLEEYYKLKTEIIKDYTENDLKQALNAGKLVILPFNGRLLGNPNFRDPGPIYHMLVVRGWDEKGFITNDPGTRNGKKYPYTWETIHNAAAEWVHAIHSTDTSIKNALIVSE